MRQVVIFLLVAFTASLLYLPKYNVAGEAGKEEQLEFVGAKRCKMCHNRKSTGKFYDNWEEKKHSEAFDLLKGDEKKNAECLKCHTTGYGKPGGFVSMEAPPDMANVQCEMCHGPGEKHIKSRKNKVIPHAWEPTKETCVKCHNKSNPNWDPERYVDEEGNKSGFIYEIAVKKVNHSAVFEELGKEPPMTGDL